MKQLYILIIFISSLTGIGCSTFLQMFGERPTVELREVTLKDANFSGGTLVFTVNVANPNKFALDVDEISYKVFLSGKEFSTAKTEKPVFVPAKDSKNIEVPLPIKFDSLWAHISQAFISKSLLYKIEGNARIGLTKIPFSKDGKLELQ